MTHVCFDSITPNAAPLSVPFTLEQRTSVTRTFFLALLLAPAIMALLLPAALSVWLLASQPEAAHISQESPVAFGQLLLLPLLAGLLCWLPLKAIAWRISRSRHVAVSENEVCVTDTSLIGTRNWKAPVAQFRGIAHNVRTSLSGTRHELILVHADDRNSILLHVADRIPQSLIDQYRTMLGLPEITSRELHRLDPHSTTWFPQTRSFGNARA